MRKLIIVSLVCLALLVPCLGCGKETTTSSSAVFTVNGETGLAAAVALTDNHIQSLVNTMQVLAMTDEVKAGSWEGMQGLLSRFSQDQSLRRYGLRCRTAPTIPWSWGKPAAT